MLITSDNYMAPVNEKDERRGGGEGRVGEKRWPVQVALMAGHLSEA